MLFKCESFSVYKISTEKLSENIYFHSGILKVILIVCKQKGVFEPGNKSDKSQVDREPKFRSCGAFFRW